MAKALQPPRCANGQTRRRLLSEPHIKHIEVRFRRCGGGVRVHPRPDAAILIKLGGRGINEEPRS
jgi:hypothetical protein